MKKRMLNVISLLLIIILASCGEGVNLDRLETPTNFVIDKNVVSFDPVLNATSYILNYDGVNYEIFDPTFTITEEGTYRVRVKAIAENHLDSLFSSTVLVKVGFLTYPEEINIINNQIVYDEINGADSYNIIINGETYNTNEKVIPYLLPGEYEISIQAISDVWIDSKFSPKKTFKITEDDRLLTKTTLTYSKNSTVNLPLFVYLRHNLNYYEFYLIDDNNEIKIDGNNLMIFENSIYLNSKYILSLIKDDDNLKTLSYEFKLVTNLGDHYITLKFSEEEKPYLFAKMHQTNLYDDLYIYFDEQDADFVQLNGHDITEDDYSYESGLLIIKANYLYKVYNMNPKRKNLIITYQFEKKEIKNIYVGFITITR